MKLRVEATFSCGGGGSGTGGAGGAGSGAVSLTVTAPDGAVVPGATATIAAPAAMPGSAGDQKLGAAHATWRPDAPLAPSTTYTMHVAGLVGGASTLTFTTGPGPFAPIKPLLVDPTLITTPLADTGPSMCCTKSLPGSCGSSKQCAGQTRVVTVGFSGKADADEPAPAAKTFLKSSIQFSRDDGPFLEGPLLSFDAFGQLVTEPPKSKLCARAHVENSLTGDAADSEPWCGDVGSLDLTSKPNCAAMLAVLSSCNAQPGASGPVGQLIPAKDTALAAYQSVCEQPGTGGSAGAGGGTAAAGAGGAAAGAGGTTAAGAGGATAGAGGTTAAGAGGAAAGAGGTTAAGAGGAAAGAGGTTAAGAGGAAAGASGAATADVASEDDGGCSVSARQPRAAGPGGLAALFAVLGLVARRRRAGAARRRDEGAGW